MKLNYLLATLLVLAGLSVGCQEMEPGPDASKAKLAEDVATRPASRRWFWWGGDPEQAAPGTKAAPAPTTPPASQG